MSVKHLRMSIVRIDAVDFKTSVDDEAESAEKNQPV